MNTPQEIRDLSNQRLIEAQILADHKMWDGAFYLAGYSVELGLKAKICENFGVPNLFSIKTEKERKESGETPVDGVKDVKDAVQTHSLYTLWLYSCLKNKFETQKMNIKTVAMTVTLLFPNWSENVRYKPCGHIKNDFVQKLLTLLSDSDGILTWIAKN